MNIDSIEEVDRDWDWYACDPEGMIGHFTTAGARKLPRTVKEDREAALALVEYFFERAPKSFAYVIRAAAENDAGGWADDSARARYLKDFTQMASAGLFTYDTHLYGGDGYFLVASPACPLLIHHLPLELRNFVGRTKSRYSFTELPYLSELDTLDW